MYMYNRMDSLFNIEGLEPPLGNALIEVRGLHHYLKEILYLCNVMIDGGGGRWIQLFQDSGMSV